MPHKNKSTDLLYWIPDPPRKNRIITMQFTLSVILTKLVGIAPDAAAFIELYVKAKNKNSPGGKTLTAEEKADLSAHLKEILDDLK